MRSSAQPTIPIMGKCSAIRYQFLTFIKLLATYAGKLTRLSEVKGIETKSKVDESVMLINISYLKTATRITYGQWFLFCNAVWMQLTYPQLWKATKTHIHSRCMLLFEAILITL